MADHDDLRLKKIWFIQSKEGKLEDHYNFNMKQDVIGTGAYANVIKATTKDGNHPRAVKILRKERISDSEKFKAEIDILKQLDHPNIIKLYETFEDHRNVYLITELCRGGEVFDRIIAKGHFTESEARKAFTEIMRAINYCHNHGVCHRDLKPENFLYVDSSPNSPIKVIDFGLAKIFADPEHSDDKSKKIMTSKVGTAYYISPEVLAGSYDESCDIWSAGAILYILLCGYPPFNGSTDLRIIEKVKKCNYDFNGPEWKNVSNSVKDLIQHMLCKPSDRLNAGGVLNHPWVLQAENQDEIPLSLNYQLLKSFTNAQKLKKVALTAIAQQMSEEEIMELSQAFTKLDKNGDGVLTFEEMKAGIGELKDKSIKEITAIFDSVDTDKNGTINYTEFITATMAQSMYMKEDKLIEAFKIFDKDGNGKITADELKDILGKEPGFQQNMEFCDKMIKEADLDGDGQIDYYEFIEMMHNTK